MNQEEIGKFIKEIRKKDGLTQEKFAEKYGVTYQAVSKWENGKSIPELSILKQICKEYKKDLNDFIVGNESINNKKQKPIYIGITTIVIIVIVVCSFIVFGKSDDDFQFKKLSTTCDNFNLYGSIAYNDNKTSIYISNISYCGEEELKYKEIECTLYESDGKTKTKISSFDYNEEETISLSEFLENVNFNIEHHSNSCKMYQENGMSLEIKATNTSNQTTFYNIPLKLEDCIE